MIAKETRAREKKKHRKIKSLSKKMNAQYSHILLFDCFRNKTDSPQTKQQQTTIRRYNSRTSGLVGSSGAYRHDTWPIPRNPPRIHYATSLANFRRITSQRPRALRFLPPFG